MSQRERLIKTAERILRNGDPLHLSLYARLLQEGVDIEALERSATR